MSNIIVLGAQWGDEGKGKLVDYFSARFDIVARYQGGHNAGHTVILGDRKIILKLIPSGILRPGKLAVIGNGLVVDPAALVQEMDSLEAAGFHIAGQLKISNRAHLIFPIHRIAERIGENRPDRVAIGTTSRGIGPSYEDKIGRRGIRMADLMDGKAFSNLLDQLVEDKETICRAFGIDESPSTKDVRRQYLEIAERLRPMICDTAKLLAEAIAQGKKVLFEGAQGSMLDVDHGTYPFVTSSNSTAGGACTGTGVPPTRINGVFGVSKAYITRVGGGPFPTEDLGPMGETLRKVGKEFGAVTGRPRRCGWFDVPLIRYTTMVNGFDSLIITKLDVLDQFDEIPVCVGYELSGRAIDEMPATADALSQVEPVYEHLPGWKTSTAHVHRCEDLPGKAKEYLEFLVKQTGVEIGGVSTGPDRDQTFLVASSRMETLLR